MVDAQNIYILARAIGSATLTVVFLAACHPPKAVAPEPYPGLGESMHRVGRRFEALYHAGMAGNGGRVRYELHEIGEALELIEAARPIKNDVPVADELGVLENVYFPELLATAEEGRPEQFRSAYERAVRACNACHLVTGYPFIEIRVPEGPPPTGQVWAPVESP